MSELAKLLAKKTVNPSLFLSKQRLHKSLVLFFIAISLCTNCEGIAPQFVPSVQAAHLPLKVVLLNDTSSWYHWGCTGTTHAIKSQIVRMGYSLSTIPIQYNYTLNDVPRSASDFNDEAFFAKFKSSYPTLVAELESADIVVVNGEGTLHGLKQGPLRLLYLAYLSKRHLNKHVEIISHSVYPNDNLDTTDTEAMKLYQLVYRAMDFVAIRESESCLMMQKLGIPATQSFDCLPLYIRSYYLPKAKAQPRSGHTLVVGGSVAWEEEGVQALIHYLSDMSQKGYQIKVVIGAKKDPAQDDLELIEYLTKHAKMKWELVLAESIEDWLKAIHEATLVVSGRFHYSIAAACLGTPFIALNSNTPKVEALHKHMPLLEVLQYSDPQLYQKLLSQTKVILSRPSTHSQKLLEELCDLAEQNFVGLQKTSESLSPAL